MNASDRKYPLIKPEGHVPPIPRYTARMPEDVSLIKIMYLGVQSRNGDMAGCLDKLGEIGALLDGENGPEYFDFAKFIDMQGCPTMFAVAYWRSPEAYDAWQQTDTVSAWWQDSSKETGDFGYFKETMSVASDYAETNIFLEYVRGLSACPMSNIKQIDETGYWGAARDRFPASAYDLFATETDGQLSMNVDRHADKTRTAIVPPKNFVVIRSGVTWQDCGEEQLTSYQKSIKPKLDIGMTYLRENPLDTGCCSLRQVDVISKDGEVAKEEFSVGYFLCLTDLETWAHEHPAHLAIFTRAIAEREKYGDDLELRTYHEIYVLAAQGSRFEYVNCHGNTGLLPFFDGE